jgi:hypothetical protein
MSVEKYIMENIADLKDKIFIAPNIDKSKMENCKTYIAKSVDDEYILAYHDATLFGNGSVGFAFTGDSFIFANEKNNPVVLPLSEIKSAKYVPKVGLFGGTKHSTYGARDKFIITMYSGESYMPDNCLIDCDCYVIEKLINGIVELINDDVKPGCTKQDIPLCEIDESAKSKYLKILCNYAYIGDENIDAKEYCTIHSIMVRMEVSASIRNEIRDYMNNLSQRSKTGVLLKGLQTELEYGSYNIVRFSLIQDILRLQSVTYPKQSWKRDDFIIVIANRLELTDNKVDLLAKSVSLRNQMAECDTSRLANMEREINILNERAVELQIPVMTLYCSGTPYTIDVYKKIFNGGKKAAIAIKEQRELMLQTIVENMQKTCNSIIMDINYLNQRLEEERQKSVKSENLINQLAVRLARVQEAQAKIQEEQAKKHYM